MAANIGMLTFSTKLDKSGLSQGLSELKGVKASIGVSLDFDDRSVARMEQRLAGMKLGLKVTVDDRGAGYGSIRGSNSRQRRRGGEVRFYLQKRKILMVAVNSSRKGK